MLYIDNEETKEVHSIDEISECKISGEDAVNLMIHAQVPYLYGATEESIIENLKYISFCLFKDADTNSLLVSPDLLEVVIDNTYEDEEGTLVYNTVKRIVSFREFMVALSEKGFTLKSQTIEELAKLAIGNEVTVDLVKQPSNKKLARM